MPMHVFTHEHTQATNIQALRCIICCKMFKDMSNEHRLRSKRRVRRAGTCKAMYTTKAYASIIKINEF